MSEVGAYEAKTHLPRLIKRVARGERIVITRHGVPVAELVPPRGSTRPVAEILADLQRASRGKRLRGLSTKDLIASGRR